jgi:hypothetical protein
MAQSWIEEWKASSTSALVKGKCSVTNFDRCITGEKINKYSTARSLYGPDSFNFKLRGKETYFAFGGVS